MKKIIASFLIITYSAAAFSHSGGTNDSGCHNDNSPGGYYHCHNDSSGYDAGAALGVLAAVALIALLFRGGSQRVISDPDKSKSTETTTTPSNNKSKPTETTTTPSNNNSKNRSLPLSQQVAN